MCTEDIPRKERAAENYLKESVCLDSKVSISWAKWDMVNKELRQLCDQAVSMYPGLKDFVDNINMRSELRLAEARADLRYKLFSIENVEMEAFSEYVSEMPSMLNKLYLILKGYEKVTPAMTAEYMEIMKKAKSAKGISWSDTQCENDKHFKFISSLDLDKPSTTMDYIIKDNVDVPVEMVSDSDDLTDTENRDILNIRPINRTPLKLANNETIIINDSLESLDATRNLNSAKKVRREHDIAMDLENFAVIDTKDLNSTFVMAGKMEPLRKVPIKIEVNVPMKRGLTDRTNTIQRTISFNDKGMSLIL